MKGRFQLRHDFLIKIPLNADLLAKTQK